jgi:hypothetical protein
MIKRTVSALARGGVMSTLLRGFVIGLAFAMAAVTCSKSAVALTYDDILGTWCGAKTNPDWTNQLIARTTLTVVHLPQNSRTILKIDHFDFTDAIVTIYYLSAGRSQQSGTGIPGKVLTQVRYGDFGPNDKTMVQKSSDIGGAYHFTRC